MKLSITIALHVLLTTILVVGIVLAAQSDDDFWLIGFIVSLLLQLLQVLATKPQGNS